MGAALWIDSDPSGRGTQLKLIKILDYQRKQIWTKQNNKYHRRRASLPPPPSFNQWGFRFRFGFEMLLLNEELQRKSFTNRGLAILLGCKYLRIFFLDLLFQSILIVPTFFRSSWRHNISQQALYFFLNNETLSFDSFHHPFRPFILIFFFA